MLKHMDTSGKKSPMGTVMCVRELTILKHMDPVFRERVAHLRTDLLGQGAQGGASYALCAFCDFWAFF